MRNAPKELHLSFVLVVFSKNPNKPIKIEFGENWAWEL